MTNDRDRKMEHTWNTMREMEHTWNTLREMKHTWNTLPEDDDKEYEGGGRYLPALLWFLKKEFYKLRSRR